MGQSSNQSPRAITGRPASSGPPFARQWRGCAGLSCATHQPAGLVRGRRSAIPEFMDLLLWLGQPQSQTAADHVDQPKRKEGDRINALTCRLQKLPRPLDFSGVDHCKNQCLQQACRQESRPDDQRPAPELARLIQFRGSHEFCLQSHCGCGPSGRAASAVGPSALAC